MELREAIEKLTMWHQANPRTGPIGVVMNAVADGTLIPAQSREEGHPASCDPEYSYDDWMKEQTQPTPSPDPVAWRARHSKTENWHLFEYRPSWWEVQPLYTSPPTHADAVFQVKEGYDVYPAKREIFESGIGHTEECRLSEALSIRSADDVRRDGFRAGIEAAAEACRRMRDLHAPTQEAIYAKIRALAAQKGDE